MGIAFTWTGRRVALFMRRNLMYAKSWIAGGSSYSNPMCSENWLKETG
jgi:hypothetical protein